MLKFWTNIQAARASEEGATMVEYGIVVALIAVVSILVVGALGVDVFNAFDQSQSNMDPGAGPTPPTP